MSHVVEEWECFPLSGAELWVNKTTAVVKLVRQWLCQLSDPTCWWMSRLINCWGSSVHPVNGACECGQNRREKKEKKRRQVTTLLEKSENIKPTSKHRFSSCCWELGHFRLRFIFHSRKAEENTLVLTRCVLDCLLLPSIASFCSSC